TVRTLIVDEIHAVVGNRRGSHLSLTIERLAALVNGPLQRIGLSATQKPIVEVAKFLVGGRGGETGAAGKELSVISDQSSVISDQLSVGNGEGPPSCFIVD